MVGPAASDPHVSAASLHELVAAGILAPSGDNSQPWSFRWQDGVLSVYLEGGRSRSFFDVGHVAALISIGAVVENIAVQAAAMGLTTEVAWVDGPECRARLRFTPGERLPDAAWVAAIPRRCVNRRPYRRQSIDPAWLVQRAAEVRAGGGELTWLTARQEIHAAATLVRKADWLRFSHRQLHEDFTAELRFTAAEAERTRDGLPIPTLESGPLAGPFLRFVAQWGRMRVLNRLGAHRLLSWQTEILMRSAPAVGLLTMPAWSDAAFLTGGRLVERTWLAATAAGLAVQPMTAITLFLLRQYRHAGAGLDAAQQRHLADLWQPFRALFGLGEPGQALIMLFRVGHAPPPHARTLRRPVESFWRT